MSEINDGGPAFPTPEIVMNGRHYKADHAGMSLRDWFAGQALAGMMANTLNDTPERWATACYILADAMLAARPAKKEAA